MKASIVDGFSWLWDHKPDVAIVFFLIIMAVLVTNMIKNFMKRFEATEKLCVDIQKTMDDRFSKVDDRFSKVEDRLSKVEDRLIKIELSLNTIITYLSTKSGKINL